MNSFILLYKLVLRERTLCTNTHYHYHYQIQLLDCNSIWVIFTLWLWLTLCNEHMPTFNWILNVQVQGITISEYKIKVDTEWNKSLNSFICSELIQRQPLCEMWAPVNRLNNLSLPPIKIAQCQYLKRNLSLTCSSSLLPSQIYALVWSTSHS